MNILGGQTKTTILIIESHKMFLEFTVGSAVQLGQPVALNTDGTIRPWVAADGRVKHIGYAYNSGYATNLVTVYMRAYHLQYAVSLGIVTAGPATCTGYSSTEVGTTGISGYNIYGNTTDPLLQQGWILSPASGANQLIRVALG